MAININDINCKIETVVVSGIKRLKPPDTINKIPIIRDSHLVIFNFFTISPLTIYIAKFYRFTL